MSFLVDTERPQKLDELTFHPSLTRTLKKLAASKDCPHLLFYGPSGGGKMTRIRCLLEGMFGPGAEKVGEYGGICRLVRALTLVSKVEACAS
ncbi:Subunit of heteropentameric Replication factor C (RF-C) [Perkinsus olseni]|uniref:Subunit of heteropentameric Replication factor C (RF-C) n=1 Tax=Perkinsus olseni TaxID=32597 RepID=A0A7J6QSY2_PEROL|nr:Subunit of heteropentameric Replication factor C (RF-C) [Perkinsus olseni]